MTLLDSINRLSALLLIVVLGLLSSQSVQALSACKKNGATVYTKACIEEMQTQKAEKIDIAQSLAPPTVIPAPVLISPQSSTGMAPASASAALSTPIPVTSVTPIASVAPAAEKDSLANSRDKTAPRSKETASAATPKCHFYRLAELVQSASKASFLACTPALLQLNQQDDRKASKGRTLLHWAIAAEQPEMAELLIQPGVDLKLLSRTDNGAQPIHLAAKKGLNTLIQQLLDQGSPLESLDYFKRTPLHWAVEANQFSSSEQLLNLGANPNASDRIGKTPLMLSIGHSDPELVTLLLNAGADPKSSNFKGQTALHLAALHSPQALQVLIEQKIDLNPLNREGLTPLMLAASIDPHHYWRSIKLLIAQGAQLNLTDPNGQTLVDYSLANNHRPLFELLLSEGVDSDQIRVGQLRGKTAFIQRLRKLGKL